MMDIVQLFAGIFLGFMLGIFIGVVASNERMREAFERGHAVQCLGKPGYHWECEK